MLTQIDCLAKSRQAFERACHSLVGGVNSPVRAYKAVGCVPITVRSGCGAQVTDIDGYTYIDYVASYGPLILGHAPASVVTAISQAAANSMSFGMPTLAETLLAERVCDAVDSIDLVRFVNSGTEAVMSAIRLARGATGHTKVIKCAGCYHGHSDALLVEAGSGATTLGVPSSAGVPAQIVSTTLLVPFNDLEAVETALQEHDDVAAMVVEPIAGNMGCVPPREGYLQGLRDICNRHQVILIFDEVMTGFRVAYGGAQALYGVEADLTCLGKVLGGGLPCAAYGGREKLMQLVAPQGPVYQAGTLSGNPLAMAAGLATLDALNDGRAYEQLETSSRRLEHGLVQAASKVAVPVQVARVGSMLCCFFTGKPVINYEQATQCDTQAFAVFFRAMLEQGLILPPSQFESWFVSTAHDADIIDRTINAAASAFEAVDAAS